MSRRLEESRERFEASLADMRGALGSELGLLGRRRGYGWVVPVVGVGVGLFLAWRLFGRGSSRSVPKDRSSDS